MMKCVSSVGDVLSVVSNGTVGIGTDPSSWSADANNLAVGNDVDDVNKGISIVTSATKISSLYFAATARPYRGYVRYYQDAGVERLALGVGGFEAACIHQSASGGKMGIGTTDPQTSSQKSLHIVHSDVPGHSDLSATSFAIERNANVSSSYMMKCVSSAGDVFTIVSDGNIGIGVGSPTNDLELGRYGSQASVFVREHMTGAGSGPFITLARSNDNADVHTATVDKQELGWLFFDGNNGTNFVTGAHIRSWQTGPTASGVAAILELATYDNGGAYCTNQLCLNPSGGVGVHTNAPGDSISFDTTFEVNGTLTSDHATLLVNRQPPYDVAGGYFILCRQSGDNIFKVLPDGNVEINGYYQANNLAGGGNQYVSCDNGGAIGPGIPSDISLKKDIETLPNVLEKISNIRGVQFKWKENDIPAIGVIAQELEKEYPILVKESSKGFKIVDYPFLTAVLLQAVNELTKRVKDLEDKIQA
jgi:hypothetical protein